MSKHSKLRISIIVALLSAIAFIFQFFEFGIPLPFLPTFLKLDISDIPAVFATVMSGGVAGILVQLIKNILHTIFFGWSGGLGELSNLIVGTGIILPYIIAKRKNLSLSGFVISGVVSIVTICVSAFISNSLITPVYMGVPLSAVMELMPGILAFNVIKAAMVMVLSLLLRLPMIRLIKR